MSPPAQLTALPVSRVALCSDDARLTAALRRGLRALGISAEVLRPDMMSTGSDLGLVIVDARSPEALATYLASAPAIQAPLIAVVPPGDQAQASSALAAGAGALLSAPIRTESLRLALQTAQADKHRDEALARQSPRESRLREAATRRAQELAALMEVSIAVAAQRDPKAVCDVTIEQLVGRFGHDLVSVYLREERGLVMQAQFGYEQCSEMIVEQGVIGRTMRLGIPQFVDDVRQDPDYLSLGDNVVAEVCVPILIGDEVMGVINVESRRPGALDLQTEELLILLARQVAITVERGRLLEEERLRANLAEALTRATAVIAFSLDSGDIYQQVLSLLGTVVRFDTAAVFRIEQGIALSIGLHARDRERFAGNEIRFPAAEDSIFGPWTRGESVGPVLILDTQLDARWLGLASKNALYIDMVRTYMAVPLIVEGELVGALTLACFVPQAFDKLTVAATLEFAELLIRALSNARVYELERAANARLQSIMKVQDDFVATVSHELRTPLTSILGFSENLLDHWDRFDDAHRRSCVVKVQRAGKRLHRLVRDLLQISRLEAGIARVHAGPLQLMPIIRHAVEELSLEFEGQVVHLGAGLHDAMLWSDGDRLRQVVGNLLDNAAKYSTHGSPIAISWSTEHPWGILSVHDRGPGIRADDLPRLFQRFSKLQSVARAGHTGTGLGLYICKQVVESLGGTIWYEYSDQDRVEGRSAFHIRLPLTEMWGPEPT
jgi:signal transduction histidine kinase/AmiR/NasT family two-component response regulator